MSVDAILENAADLYRGRKEFYPKDNWPAVGDILRILLPDGIKIESSQDQERYHIFTWLIGKMCRYSQNYEKGGHEDSLKDLIVYAAILKDIDDKIAKYNEIPF